MLNQMIKNLKIRSRMLISYFIIVFLLLIVGITSIVMLNQSSQRLQQFYDLQFKTVSLAMDARRTVFSARGNILSCIVEYSDAAYSNASSDFDYLYTLIDDLKEIEEKSAGSSQNGSSQLSEVEAKLNQASAYLPQILDLAAQQKDEESLELYKSNYKPHMDSSRDILANLCETAEANALANLEKSRQLARIADVIVIALIAAAVVVSVILALFMSDSVRKPVEEMRQVAARICKGDMSVAIAYHSGDELGEMADNMRHMTETVKVLISDINYCMKELAQGNFTVKSKNPEAYVGDYSNILHAMRAMKSSMSETLSRIESAANQVNAGGDQVSSGAQALAQGATQQASSVEELAATIQDVSKQVESTASHARTAKKENEQSHQQIGVCFSDMESLLNAMNKIETHSSEISKVIKTIEDIAFQTNILALNAAVEAARAGAAGKGFAVVADEVRNLASKSAEASKSTATLIEDTVKAVKEGLDLSHETSQALQIVVESSQKVLDAVGLIAGAAEEQTASISQISTAVDQISSVVQTNSATSQESAAASEELSSQANVLKELIGRFRLEDSYSAAGVQSEPRAGSNAAGVLSEPEAGSSAAAPYSQTDRTYSSFGDNSKY